MADPQTTLPRSSHPTEHTRRKPRPRRRTGPTWRVHAIDSEPMTAAQHQAAVHALAALINAWHDDASLKTSKPPTNPGHEPP